MATQGCACGFYNDPTRECHCTPLQIQRYVGRISGPPLDRIDIHIDVPAVRFKELADKSAPEGESSADIRARVLGARRALTHWSPSGTSRRTKASDCFPARTLN